MKRVARAVAFLALSFSLAAAACLPDPATKAEISVIVHAGPREFVTADNYVLRFTRRVAIVGVSTTSTSGSGGSSAAQIRNLDAPPFTFPPLRALGERFVGVHTQSFYERQVRGPDVTDEDVDALDGNGDPARDNEPNDLPRLRTGAVSFFVSGAIERRYDGEVWTFDWRASPFVSAICGHQTEAGLVPIYFETESHHALEVEVRLERFFALEGEPDTLRAREFVDADANEDHVITSAELAKNESRRGFDNLLRIFEIKLDGTPLVCRLPSDVLQNFF